MSMNLSRILGAAAVAALLAPTFAHAQDKLLVAIYKSGTQQYFIDQADGFKAKAKELGFDANTFNVELDANLAINTINDAVAQGAKGIAITVPDQAIGPAIAKIAADAKIPLVATDDSIKDGSGNPLPFVGFDGHDMGTKVGKSAAELLDKAGWVKDSGVKFGVLSVEVQTLSVCNDRTNAARDEVKKVGVTDDEIFAVPYSGTTDDSLSAAGPIITAHPDIDHWVVFACNDEGVLGTLNALANAGAKPENVIGVGLGAYEACRPWKQGIASGFKSALFISGKDVGAAAAEVLAANIDKGTPLPPKTVANTTIVGPDNYAQYFPCD